MSRRRILFIGKFPPIQGGVSRNNDLVAEQLGALGHEVLALTNSGDYPFSALMYGDFAAQGYVLDDFTSAIFATPQSDGSITRLISRALEVIEDAKIEVVISSYLEPYGVVGSTISAIKGIPHIFIHAGSDIERLCKVKSLSTAYRQVFKTASLVLTTPSRHKLLQEFGAQSRSLFPALFGGIDPAYFNTQPVAQSFPDFRLEYLQSSHYSRCRENINLPYDISPNNQNYLVYGKLAACKGIYDLIAALSVLVSENPCARFHLVCHGDQADHTRLKTEIFERGLEGKVFNFPFVQNRMLPNIIRQMDAVFAMEGVFDFQSHASTIPLEILSCGALLVTSKRTATCGKVPFNHLTPGESVIALDEENLIDGIRALFTLCRTDKEKVKQISGRGLEIASQFKRPQDMRSALSAMLKIASIN